MLSDSSNLALKFANDPQPPARSTARMTAFRSRTIFRFQPSQQPRAVNSKNSVRRLKRNQRRWGLVVNGADSFVAMSQSCDCPPRRRTPGLTPRALDEEADAE